MKAYRSGSELHFFNYERVSDRVEFKRIVAVLKANGCVIEKTVIAPDCDIINCTLGSVDFTLIRTIDGDGSFIYCDTVEKMKRIETMFEMTE